MSPPSRTLNFSVSIFISPPLPLPPGSTEANKVLSSPKGEVPITSTSVAEIVKFPPFPSPKEPVSICAPSITLNLSVLISISPPFPTTPGNTTANKPLDAPSTEAPISSTSVAEIFKFPVFP